MWVVFNGEIYNFMEIRSELERAGHRFRTRHGHRSDRPRDTNNGETRPFTVFAACSRSRSGTNRGAGCCWSATGSASSRSTTPSRPPASRSVRKSSRCSRIRTCRKTGAGRRWTRISRCCTCPARRRSIVTSTSSPPVISSLPKNGRASVRRYWDLTFTGDGDPHREDEYLDRLDALVTEAVRSAC